MASPFQSSDRSSSSRRSTPVRSLPNGDQRLNGFHRSHRDSFDDSPSRQLLEDFGRMLVNDDRAFKRSLDEQTAVQQKRHIEALNDALAKHKAVRERAERARERVELELERDRRQREEDERKAIEKARRDVEEQKLQEQRRQLEDAKVREEERKKQQALSQEQEDLRQSVEAQKQREAEHSRRQSEVRKQQEAEQLRKSTQEAAQRAESARQASEAQQQQQQQATSQQTSATTLQQNGASSMTGSAARSIPSSRVPDNSVNLPGGIMSTAEERMAVHKQYLDLHKRLKQMREQVSQEVKKISGLKDQLSDWRRAIKKCVGQLMKGSSDEIKRKNKRVTEEIVQHLDAASRVAEPSIDVTQYLVENRQPPGASTQGPAVLVFLLNHFAKSIVGQFALEGAFESKIADVIGVLAVTVFARPQYLFNGQSLIDILWAKYHQRCPVLFGISGSERTQAGRARLGWGVEGGSFVQPDEHYTRMTGLGSGFAALTLRDFSRSKNANPAPNRIFWESMARILNTPATDVQPTHFVVLKAMIENFVPRIIGTFGGAGIAVLRQALIVFPNEKGPQDEKGKKLPSVTALQSMPVLLQRDLHLTL